MRPERRFHCRNANGRLPKRSPQRKDYDPSNISLFEAKNGLDDGVHFTATTVKHRPSVDHSPNYAGREVQECGRTPWLYT